MEDYILSFRSAVILEVVGGRDRSHYPSIQVLDFGAAPPQTLGAGPVDEAGRYAALEEEEEDGAESLPERPPLLGLAIAHLRARNSIYIFLSSLARDRVCVRDSEEYQYLTIFKNKPPFIFTFRNRETNTWRIPRHATNSKNSNKRIYIYICRRISAGSAERNKLQKIRRVYEYSSS